MIHHNKTNISLNKQLRSITLNKKQNKTNTLFSNLSYFLRSKNELQLTFNMGSILKIYTVLDKLCYPGSSTHFGPTSCTPDLNNCNTFNTSGFSINYNFDILGYMQGWDWI